MTYEAGVVCHYSPETGHRRFMVLTPAGVGPAYRVREGTGAWVHLSTEQLRGYKLWDAVMSADQAIDELQPLGIIELDGYDMLHLSSHSAMPERQAFFQRGNAMFL